MDFLVPNFAYISAVTLLILILFLMKILVRSRKWKNTPPAPYGLPIVGFLPFLTRKPHVKLMQLGKKYGDIFSLKLGSKTIVVLNSGEMVREAFSKPELLGRPEQEKLLIVPMNSPFLKNGGIWTQHRRFTQRFLKELDDKNSTEFHMKAEIENFMTLLADQESKPFDMTYYLSSSVSNNISAMIFGKRYEFSDPERQYLDKILIEGTRLVGLTSAVVFFPWLKSIGIFRKILKLDELLELNKGLATMAKKKLKERKENPNEERTKDFIDFYLSELSSANKASSTFSENFIPDSIQVLYGAGSETVRTTLLWSFYTMAVYQDAQKEVQKEIDEIIGYGRRPSLSDQKYMPYTQSVIMEIQRWQTVIPLGVLRVALEDTDIAGYHIPKDTFVMPNLWAVHRDPRCWNDPDEFIPDRFLSTDRTQVIKNINYMPFSFGKRNCLGERIAVMEVFLYFTSILQRFKLRLPKNTQPNFDGQGSIMYQMKPQNLCFIPRSVEESSLT